ncbi:response regulator transcription factor [Polaribacter staleyi]|uniref:response regulator n=1 Tax=Polaribacter staleyi TaxID=2022337 RepID=UPI0031B9CA8E
MKSKKNNLLIVEDNSFVAKAIVNAANEISSIGDVCLTESLQEAISFFDNTYFELVVLDLKLPDGHGIELLKILKEKQIETKVFVFSVSTELKLFCLKYGALAFFDKAKDFDELIEAITNA